MTYIPDLAQCSYVSSSDQVVAVGWLGPENDYARGAVSQDVFSRMVDLLVDPWEPLFLLGSHDCEFCRFSESTRTLTYQSTTVSYGVSNLYIPGDGRIYVAPSMIVHYIDRHEYSPPQEFCEAVMACADMDSMDYKNAILKHGPDGFATGPT